MSMSGLELPKRMCRMGERWLRECFSDLGRDDGAERGDMLAW